MTKYYAFWSHLALICLSTEGGKIFIFKTSFISWCRRHIELSLCQPFESVTMSHSDAPLHFDASFHPCSDFWWQCFMTMLHDNATPKRIKKVRTKKEASKTTISISPRQAMNMWQRHRALSGLQDMHSPLTVLSKNLHNKINSLTWKWF